MTSLLQNAIDKAKSLPNHRQDDVGNMILAMVEQSNSDLRLSEEQQAEVLSRLSRPMDFVPEADMTAFFRKFAR